MNPVGNFKEWLQDHLDELKEKSPAKKHELNALYQQVTIAYEQSLNNTLVLGNEEVRALAEQLNTIQEEITRDIDRAEDIAGVIDKITMGVGIAARIAGFLIKT
jgi:argininosuccinate lyase